MFNRFSLFLIILFVINFSFGQNKRSQTPKAPFNYRVEEVVFQNTIDQVKLAGTFTKPSNSTTFPTVILISGSGPQNRNSSIFNHSPFAVIADYFAKNGIAVLRIDDRGIEGSEGEHNATHLNGFVRDIEAGVSYLKTRKDIDTTKIGLIGHSLGGVIAPIIASQSADIGFIIMLAGPAIPGNQLMLKQKELIEQKMGVPELAVIQGQTNIKGAYDIIHKNKDNSSLNAELVGYFSKTFGDALPKNQIEAIAKQLSIPWLADFIRHDPKPYLENVKCPILALNGTLDLQVPSEVNLAAIRKAADVSGNTNVTTISLKKLNHLFQKGKTGLPDEYQNIAKTISPKVLKLMRKWILKNSSV